MESTVHVLYCTHQHALLTRIGPFERAGRRGESVSKRKARHPTSSQNDDEHNYKKNIVFLYSSAAGALKSNIIPPQLKATALMAVT